MEKMADAVSRLLWGPWTVIFIIAAGIWLSAVNGWMQLRHPLMWLKGTVGGRSAEKNTGSGATSPFQSAMAALAGTLGTGNIVGVATALTLGGAGAIFWMWTAALFGMMTAYSENVLGILYRRRDGNGDWLGGPMMYMERGLGWRKTASLWAFFCAGAAFGVGNLTQVNSIASSAYSAWGVPPWLTGVVVAAAAAPAILGGVKSVAKLAEKLVPVMAAVYMFACAAVLAVNFRKIPDAFGMIAAGIFQPSAVGGGVLGAMLAGVRRGVFTNEAGLGSSVLVHSTSDVRHPAVQGMWGIFEVFADTVVMCTVTALVILTSGAMDQTGADGQPLDGAELSAAAFSQVFGRFSGSFIAAALLLFAFATIVSWSCYGERTFGYLCGTRYTIIYKLAYVIMIIPGGMMKLRTAWALSDIFNGLMALPNTLAVVLLWREVAEQTRGWLGQEKS